MDATGLEGISHQGSILLQRSKILFKLSSLCTNLKTTNERHYYNFTIIILGPAAAYCFTVTLLGFPLSQSLSPKEAVGS